MPSSAESAASPLPGVDRAAFAIAFTERLRTRGARVDLDAAGTLARALAVRLPDDTGELYWTARVCLVRRSEDLARFDAVFAESFEGGMSGTETIPAPSSPRVRDDSPGTSDSGDEPEGEASGGLPWATLSPSGESEDEETHELPELSPSDLEARAEEPFERLSDAEITLLGEWLATLRPDPPRRRTRRRARGRTGGKVSLRATLTRARRTGWEPLTLVRERPEKRPRRVVVLCDVSGSMRAQAAAHLHLARALTSLLETETFAFGTRTTRLTPLLRRGTVDEAVAKVTEAVTDRFGGTRIAASLRELLASRHGALLRGAVVVVLSDGWDSDSPEAMTAAMTRLRRRAHRIVWANPRAAAHGFTPSTGGMSAALPHCDALLPAHGFTALRDVIEAVAAETATRRTTAKAA
ncbi:vWA domain-containing protein [Nocardiopsis sp. NPDC055551]